MALNLLFLWHMHQPDYRDKNGYLSMPWVFLHSVKDYFDMPFVASKNEEIKATFNLTPTLIEQIRIYEKYGYEKDLFLANWIKEPDLLSKDEQENIIKICKSAQFESAVKPFERFVELYKKDDFSNDEMVDLEVLFLLSWCGAYLKNSNDTVKELIKKGSSYTQNDKKRVLDELINFIKEILPFYKKLLKQKRISLSTTPYNHPILPLLLDMQNASISNPDTKLPKGAFPLEDDANLQIKNAIKLFQDIFEESPSGFWPAEGAVDKKSIRLYKKWGIKWVATDEAILFKSIKNSEKKNIYSLYSFEDVSISFRDHTLSDAIGFTYKDYDPQSAVEDFIKKIKNITDKDDRTVFIILDGENAWEFYKNGGYDFLDILYDRLSAEEDIFVKRFDDIVNQKNIKLEHLHPGSWIYGNFNTWVGEYEKNRAWELLFQTKKDTLKSVKTLTEDKQKLVQTHFLSAECSDWFWWYGSDHFSDFLLEFDQLFRSHLISIYKICNLKIPYEFEVSITKERRALSLAQKPQMKIDIKINGKVDSFYEWLQAGSIDESKSFSTMDGKKKVIEKIYYGENDEAVFIRFDTDAKKFLQIYKEIKIDIKESKKSIAIPVKTNYKKKGVALAVKDIVEFSFSKKYCKKGIINHIKLILFTKKSEIEFLPTFSEIEVCDDKEYEKNWFI